MLYIKVKSPIWFACFLWDDLSQTVAFNVLCMPQKALRFHFKPVASTSTQSHSIVLVDLNKVSSIIWKVQQSHSRCQKTTSNLLGITLKGRLRVSNEQSSEGAMYINICWNSWGIPRNYFFSQNFSIYWWFQTKLFTRLLEFIKLCKQTPLEFFTFIFPLFSKTILWLYTTIFVHQKYVIAFLFLVGEWTTDCSPKNYNQTFSINNF